MTLAKPYTMVEGQPTSTHFVKDSPEAHTCVYIYQNGREGGIEFITKSLFTISCAKSTVTRQGSRPY